MVGIGRLAHVHPVTYRAYETGARVAPPEVVQRLANVLERPLEYFYGSDLEIPDPTAASFRALSSMTALKRDAALASAAFAFEFNSFLVDRMEFPAADVPELTGVDPEAAADAVRMRWGLGDRPIRNVIQLLESRGVRVFSLAEACHEVDAFSLWRKGTPYVFLNNQKSAEHSRHDAAHELGHLILHREGAVAGRHIEKEAHEFASAFLMPRSSVLESCQGPKTVRSLVRWKKEWGVSVAALTVRLHRVGLITAHQYRVLFTQLSSLGFRSTEPDEMQRDTSTALRKALEILREDRVQRGQIASALLLNPEDLDDLTFGLTLTPAPASGQPPLKLLKSRSPRDT